MKIQKASRWFNLLFLMTLVAGCGQSTETKATVSPEIPVAGASAAATISPTLTPAITVTSTPSSTPTTVPALPAEAARERLLDLLANNGGCKLPCLWGIMPGKSMSQEVQSILVPLSSISSIFEIEPRFGRAGGFVLPGFAEGENDLMFNTKVSYLVDNQIVSRMIFYAREERIPTDSAGNWISRQPVFGLPTFIKRTEYYSLSHLLSEQGIPASVMIASSGLSTNRDGSVLTYLVIIYPEQGIWAQYTTLINEKEIKNDIISCPKNAHIQMELYPPGNPDLFFTLLEQTDWGLTKNSYKSLEEAASMSVEEFYETFRNPTEKCLTTPVSIWPAPDR